MKNRSHRYDINRPWYRHGNKYNKYKKKSQYDDALYIKQHLVTFEAQFMKKLSNTEAELKKALLMKKSVYLRNGFLFICTL